MIVDVVIAPGGNTQTYDGVKRGPGVLFTGPIGPNMVPIEMQRWGGHGPQQDTFGEIAPPECQLMARPRMLPHGRFSF